jgi:hypothetical protein
MKNGKDLRARDWPHPSPHSLSQKLGSITKVQWKKAKQMIDDAVGAGCECVKFQSHVIEDEMIPKALFPGKRLGEYFGTS